ncbi:MAG: type II toxin-antitoxin system RelE/ParE family toxin [Brachymonas sp.]|nr:type II toxin-antitoxin system RelE/ParE family toxin [Brachymonas sp.]
MKQLIISAQADADFVAFYDHYLMQAGERVAAQFDQRSNDALTHIQRFPRTGSTRYAHLTPTAQLGSDESDDIMMLRCWTYRQFPLIIFYIEHQDIITIIRVLHQASDLPQHLTTPLS